MALPNFLIFGAAKSGTTSLQMYLKQHPEIFFPDIKEPNFYALKDYKLPRPGPAPEQILQELLYSRSVVEKTSYEALFENSGTAKAIGEASVRYLYFPEAAQGLYNDIPDVRLIALLREPVSRLYSHYCMNRQYQLEPLSLEDALEAEKERVDAGWGWDWHYTGLGQYGDQLSRFFQLFNPEQIKVFFHDEFKENPRRVIRECFEHLDVDTTFEPDISRKGKVAYRGRNQILDRWLHWPNASREMFEKVTPVKFSKEVTTKLRDWNSADIPPLSLEQRKTLKTYFADDLKILSDLLGREIPWAAQYD